MDVAFNLKLILKYNSNLHESCIQRNGKRILIKNQESSTSNEAKSKPTG